LHHHSPSTTIIFVFPNSLQCFSLSPPNVVTSLSVGVFLCLCVCLCVYVCRTKCKKFLPIESYVSRSRITETSRTNYQGIPKKVREKLNYLCLWSPWWRSFGVCMCVSEWLCEYAHKSMQRILIENVCRKCDHHSNVLGWEFTWWWSGQTKSENSKIHKK